MIQSEILSRPRHPPQSFKIFTNHYSFFPGTFIRRIRGFRFLMAAGSQSVEGWAKKLDPVQLGKKIHFSSDRTLFNSRASPRCWRRHRLRPQTLHQRYVLKLRNYWIVTKMGGLGGRRRMPTRPSSHPALLSLLECSPLLAPSRAATPLCPENGRYHSTSIRYYYQRTFLWSNIPFFPFFFHHHRSFCIQH